MDKLTSSGYNRTLTLLAAEATSTESNQSALQLAMGRVSQAPSLAEELLTAGGFWGSRCQFSWGTRFLVDEPTSNGWSHTHEHMGSTNWII